MIFTDFLAEYCSGIKVYAFFLVFLFVQVLPCLLSTKIFALDFYVCHLHAELFFFFSVFFFTLKLAREDEYVSTFCDVFVQSCRLKRV